jgi:hypothetical protein
MQQLEMTCERCAVAAKCPKKGASPAFTPGGKRALCRILGGYGRVPVDPGVLSPESLARSKKDGPCLTLAEVPVVEDGQVGWELTKIFSHPVIGAREKPDAILGDHLLPKNPGT